MKKENPNEPEQGRKEMEQSSFNLDKEEIERLPDAAAEDYRLPKELPEEEEDYNEFPDEEISDEDEDELIDEDTDISPTEIALLEEAERDNSSDETLSSDMLDEVDDDGDPLNESSGEYNSFDTGADLDMPTIDPDADIDDEQD